MKIVSVMTTSSHGGGEFAAVDMLDALVDRGHETVMITDLPAIARDRRVAVRPIDLGPKLSSRTWPAVVARFVAHARTLRLALEREWPYDVLLLHYKKEQLLSRWLPRRLQAGLVWQEWGPIPVQMRTGLGRRLYLDAARNAQAVMAISEQSKSSVVELGVDADKVEVIPNVMRSDELRFSAAGRARQRAALEIPDDAFVVGCVSRFHPKKRNDVVLDAAAAVDGAHVVLAGSGESEPELRRLAEQLNGYAHFLPTPRANITDVMSSFDVSVFCPSPAEGAPRAVLLGMLMERPCVSTGQEGVGGLIVAETGEILSPENDPQALAGVLDRYRSDPERRARQGAAGRARAIEMCDAPVIAERIERLFEAAARP